MNNNPFSYSPAELAKAIVGALLAALTSLEGAWPDGVTGEEWLGVAIAAVVTFGAVFGISNRKSGG